VLRLMRNRWLRKLMRFLLAWVFIRWYHTDVDVITVGFIVETGVLAGLVMFAVDCAFKWADRPSE
jgi:hypothetical protein